MITIKKRSELLGAEKFGSCTSCGIGTDESEIFKLEFEDINNSKSSLSACDNCMIKLKEIISV